MGQISVSRNPPLIYTEDTTADLSWSELGQPGLANSTFDKGEVCILLC